MSPHPKFTLVFAGLAMYLPWCLQCSNRPQGIILPTAEAKLVYVVHLYRTGPT